MKDKNVTFIRKNGRVIPIKTKNGAGSNNKKNRTANKRKLTDWKKHRSSNAQRSASKGSIAGAAIGAGAAMFSKKSSIIKGGAIGAAIGAAAGLLKYRSSGQGKTDAEYIDKYKKKLGGSSI